MNKNIEPVELSYYQLSLQSFLRESHPELANDTEFITSRGNLAAQTYSQSIKAGQMPNHAEALASEVLYKGLHLPTLQLGHWNARLIELVSMFVQPDRHGSQ